MRSCRSNNHTYRWLRTPSWSRCWGQVDFQLPPRSRLGLFPVVCADHSLVPGVTEIAQELAGADLPLSRWPATITYFLSDRTAYSAPSSALRRVGLPGCASRHKSDGHQLLFIGPLPNHGAKTVINFAPKKTLKLVRYAALSCRRTSYGTITVKHNQPWCPESHFELRDQTRVPRRWKIITMTCYLMPPTPHKPKQSNQPLSNHKLYIVYQVYFMGIYVHIYHTRYCISIFVRALPNLYILLLIPLFQVSVVCFTAMYRLDGSRM